MAVVVAGLDGFKKRWVCIVLRDGAFDSARIFVSLQEAVRGLSEAAVIAVDTPIGFPAGCGRRAEHEAKRFVGPRRNSIFLTMPRAVYRATTYAQAQKRAKRLTDKGLSRQSFALREKMLEAEDLVGTDDRIIEVHPEVSFRELARRCLHYAKRTWRGLMLRRKLLVRAGIMLPVDLASGSPLAGDTLDPGKAGADDVLDAAVAAWTAYRKATGNVKRFPASADAEPSEGVIWY